MVGGEGCIGFDMTALPHAQTSGNGRKSTITLLINNKDIVEEISPFKSKCDLVELSEHKLELAETSDLKMKTRDDCSP